MNIFQESLNTTITKPYKNSSTYKWRISNPDKYIVLSRKHSLAYYYRHKERILQQQREQREQYSNKKQ
jgi:hypothetical protein